MTTTPTSLEIARQRVADRYQQPYHKRAILDGQWDSGGLVRTEQVRVEDELRAAGQDVPDTE